MAGSLLDDVADDRRDDLAIRVRERALDRLPCVAPLEVRDDEVPEHALGVRPGALQVQAQCREAAEHDADSRLDTLDGANCRQEGGERIALPGAVVSQQVGLVATIQRRSASMSSMAPSPSSLIQALLPTGGCVSCALALGRIARSGAIRRLAIMAAGASRWLARKVSSEVTQLWSATVSSTRRATARSQTARCRVGTTQSRRHKGCSSNSRR